MLPGAVKRPSRKKIQDRQYLLHRDLDKINKSPPKRNAYSFAHLSIFPEGVPLTHNLTAAGQSQLSETFKILEAFKRSFF